jgi:hypothetical protein
MSVTDLLKICSCKFGMHPEAITLKLGFQYRELQRSNKFSSIWLCLPKFSVGQVQEAVI